MKYFILLPILLAANGLRYGDRNIQNSYSPVKYSTLIIANKFIADSAQPLSDKQSEGTNTQNSEAKQVQEDVVNITQATFEGNVDTVINYTHPQIISMLGGMAQARSVLEDSFSEFQSLGMKMESLVFPEAPTFIESSTNDFVIVPTTTIILSEGYRIESSSYQFGIKQKGTKDWKYIEGSRINQQNVQLLFPDFPSDYEFPEYSQQQL